MIRAWIAAAPWPIPYCLAEGELRRIARNYGIDVDAELERRETERLLAAAERAVRGVTGCGDEGELVEGEP